MKPAIFALVWVVASTAWAQSVPSSFLSDSDCLAATRDCTCADAPFMEIYRDQQKKGRSAWISVGTSIPPPTSPAAAQAAFAKLFTEEPRITTQLSTCPGYNSAVNLLSKVAGVRANGATAFDPCFCNAFCKDIIQSTIDHESAHRPTLVLGFLSGLPVQTACKAISAAQPICDVADAQTLVNSETISYTLGINTLNNAIDRIASGPDAANPGMQCTWTPLPPVTALRHAPVVPIPSSRWKRLTLLIERFWNGVTA